MTKEEVLLALDPRITEKAIGILADNLQRGDSETDNDVAVRQMRALTNAGLYVLSAREEGR